MIASATIEIPTLAPTITPMPPTSVPTPVVLNAAQVWASPATPLILREKFQSWGFQILATEQASANLYIDVAQTSAGAAAAAPGTFCPVLFTPRHGAMGLCPSLRQTLLGARGVADMSARGC